MVREGPAASPPTLRMVRLTCSGEPAWAVAGPVTSVGARSALVTGPATARAGSPLQVSRTIRNVGGLAAGPSRTTWVLSENEAVSFSDRALSVTRPGGLPDPPTWPPASSLTVA